MIWYILSFITALMLVKHAEFKIQSPSAILIRILVYELTHIKSHLKMGSMKICGLQVSFSNIAPSILVWLNQKELCEICEWSFDHPNFVLLSKFYRCHRQQSKAHLIQPDLKWFLGFCPSLNKRHKGFNCLISFTWRKKKQIIQTIDDLCFLTNRQNQTFYSNAVIVYNNFTFLIFFTLTEKKRSFFHFCAAAFLHSFLCPVALSGLKFLSC